jgi:hypothetical protein
VAKVIANTSHKKKERVQLWSWHYSCRIVGAAMEQARMINVFRQNPNWRDHVRLLKEVDQLWLDRPGYGGRLSVFGPRPSWTDTIARSGFLLDAENWSELDEDQVTLIAPTHDILNGDALLASIGRRSTDVRSFLFDASRAEDRNFVLQRLKAIRNSPTTALIRDGGKFLGDLCEFVASERALRPV